jgi:hypothetical protein
VRVCEALLMASQDAPPAASPRADVIASLRQILADGLRFVRAEMGLARAEGSAAAKRAALAAGLLAAAAVGLLLSAVLLLGAAAEAIGGALHHPWLGWLIMAGLLLVIVGVLGGLGYRMVRRTIAEGRRVGATVKEDLEWVRELLKPNANGS